MKGKLVALALILAAAIQTPCLAAAPPSYTPDGKAIQFTGPGLSDGSSYAVSTAISSATATPAWIPRKGLGSHVQLTGTAVATCYLERQLDGATWTPITVTVAGSTIIQYQYAYNSVALGEDFTEGQYNVAYRLDCGAQLGSYTSGTLTVRFSE